MAPRRTCRRARPWVGARRRLGCSPSAASPPPSSSSWPVRACSRSSPRWCCSTARAWSTTSPAALTASRRCPTPTRPSVAPWASSSWRSSRRASCGSSGRPGTARTPTCSAAGEASASAGPSAAGSSPSPTSCCRWSSCTSRRRHPTRRSTLDFGNGSADSMIVPWGVVWGLGWVLFWAGRASRPNDDQLGLSEHALSDFASADRISAIAALVLTASAVFAILVVLRLTRRQEEQAELRPPTAAAARGSGAVGPAASRLGAAADLCRAAAEPPRRRLHLRRPRRPDPTGAAAVPPPPAPPPPRAAAGLTRPGPTPRRCGRARRG